MASIGSKGNETRFMGTVGWSVVCILAAVAMLILLPPADSRLGAVRQGLFDLASPVINLMSVPFRYANEWRKSGVDIMAFQEKYAALEEENRVLKKQLEELVRAKTLVSQYRKLLALPKEPNLKTAAARVIADTSGSFTRSVIANIGREAGVLEGQAVLGDEGLIGRVVSVGRSSSRILLLTDFNSKIPVLALASDARGILTGRSGARPVLEFLPRRSKLKEGDLLVTSGDGGEMPVGLPVGFVRFDEGEVWIELQEDFRSIDYVRIILAVNIAPPPDVRSGLLPKGGRP